MQYKVQPFFFDFVQVFNRNNMARERIPRVITELNAYINSTTDYLLTGDNEKNWERLRIGEFRKNKWVEFRESWNKYYALYADKAASRTTAVKDNLKKVKADFIEFAQPALRVISGGGTVSDFLVFHIKAGSLRKQSKTAITEPKTHPVMLSININESLMHIIRIKDELLSGRGKPHGVGFCQVFCFIGTEKPKSADEAKQYAHSTRTKMKILFKTKDKGKTAFYFFRWVSLHGHYGPHSPMYSAVIT